MTYRVIQWSTGNVGQAALRAIIRHPELELSGVWVSSDEKVGKDAGELCGLEPVGVPAARPNIEAVLALEPDCVLYMANHTDDEVLCRLLESGVNVVSSAGELHRRESIEPGFARRLKGESSRMRMRLRRSAQSRRQDRIFLFFPA